MSAETQHKSGAMSQQQLDYVLAQLEKVMDEAVAEIVAAPLRAQIVRNCINSYVGTYDTQALATSWKSPELTFSMADAWRDYMSGAALSLDPLPVGSQTFCTSDIGALCSDWLAVDADLGKTWRTVELTCNYLGFSDVKHRAKRVNATIYGGVRATNTRDNSSGS